MFHESFLAMNQERNREAALLNFIQTVATKEGIRRRPFFSTDFYSVLREKPSSSD